MGKGENLIISERGREFDFIGKGGGQFDCI